MNCPFCAEEIKDEALVCRHCHRDLSVLRPVLDRLRPLTERLDTLEAAKATIEDLSARLAAVEAVMDQLKAGGGAGIEAASVAVLPAAASASTPPNGFRFGRWLGRLVLALVVPILALVLAHWLVVMVFDLKTWVIRTVSLVLPLPFGFAALLRTRHRLPVQALLGLVIAAVSVAAMSAVTGLIDNAPIWPQDGRDWRELIEYGVSIWLSYLTGALIRQQLQPVQTDKATQSTIRRLAQHLATLTAPENETRAEMEKRIQTLSGTIGTVVPLVTGVTSIIAGVHKLME